MVKYIYSPVTSAYTYTLFYTHFSILYIFIKNMYILNVKKGRQYQKSTFAPINRSNISNTDFFSHISYHINQDWKWIINHITRTSIQSTKLKKRLMISELFQHSAHVLIIKKVGRDVRQTWRSSSNTARDCGRLNINTIHVWHFQRLSQSCKF